MGSSGAHFCYIRFMSTLSPEHPFVKIRDAENRVRLIKATIDAFDEEQRATLALLFMDTFNLGCATGFQTLRQIEDDEELSHVYIQFMDVFREMCNQYLPEEDRLQTQFNT